MSHKVHPLVFRIGINKNWRSRWFSKKNYRHFLKQDLILRDFITKQLIKAGIDKVEIERSANAIAIKIFAARPGMVIGRGGSGIEDLKKEVVKIIKKEDPQLAKTQIKIEIEEVRQPEIHATIMAQNLAEQLEKRMPYRRAIKQTLDKVIQNKEAQGVKVLVSGRLNGSEIARSEWLKKGKIPLQTLRSDIDYSQATAFTSYGTIGVKIWIYKGEKFNE